MNYLLHGTESYRLKKKLEELVLVNDSNNQGMNTFYYDVSANDFSWKNVLEEAWMIPFFGEKKTMVLQNPLFLTGSGSLNEKDAVLLEQYLNQSCPSTDIIFYGDMEQLDQRKKITKLIQKTCRVFTMQRMEEREFHSYVVQMLKVNQVTLNQEALQELMDRLPLDMEVLHHELEKLVLFGKKITKEDIEHLVCRPIDEDVFHLVNAVVQRDLKQALHRWEDCQVLNKDPIYLIVLLASQFRLMSQVRILMDRRLSEQQIVQQLKAHPFRIKKAREAVSSQTSQRLLEILNQLADLDQKLKNGTIEKKFGFEMFLIKTAR